MSTSKDTILFYTPGACSLSCMVALEWLGEAYRLCRIDKDVRAGAVYRRVNPRGKVPALRVDGETLVEANAILVHIADRSRSVDLLPANGTWKRDIANQWLAYLGSGFHPAFWPYFSPQRYVTAEVGYEGVRQAAVEAIRRELALVNAHLGEREYILGAEVGYEGVRQAAVEAIRRELALVNTHLGEREYILGAERSVLDAYLHSMDRWANKIVDVPNEYPHVRRHQEMMAKDPAVRVALSIERGDVPRGDGPFKGHVDLADIV